MRKLQPLSGSFGTTSRTINRLVALTFVLLLGGSGRAASIPPVPPAEVPLTAAVFAGHIAGKVSGNSRGVKSHSGILEYLFNDQVVAQFQFRQLSGGIRYLLFFATENIDLHKRPSLAQKKQADVYIEIHHDAGQDSDIALGKFHQMQGFSLHYSGRNPYARESRQLAELIGDKLLERGFHPNHYHAKDIDGERRNEVDRARAIYDRDLYVNAHARMPSVLVECGCVVCPEEERQLKTEATRKAIAGAVHAALVEYRRRHPPGASAPTASPSRPSPHR